MSRHFPDFLKAYYDFARDGFSPDKFHLWTGISVLAAALERRVWVMQAGRQTFPNLYVFLISIPGEGKSAAGNIGVPRLLRKVRRNGTHASFLPQQMSEAAFVDSMKANSPFLIKVLRDGQWRIEEVRQCAHFMFASEGSNTMKEMAGGGEITAALTAFYDCDDDWEKKTIGGGSTFLKNICCNILVGCTFQHMNVLFPPSRIMGGFASRITYIASKDTKGREIQWEPKERSEQTEAKLLADLNRIFCLSGQFTVTREFADAFVAFFRDCDAHRKSLEDERLQAFLARRHTNMLKLSMVCSVSESDSLVLEKRHWDTALSFLPEMDSSLELVMDSAADPNTQMGVNQLVLNFVKRGRRVTPLSILKFLTMRGTERSIVLSTITQLTASGFLRVDSGSHLILGSEANADLHSGNGIDVKEVAEPADRHLQLTQ